LVDTVFAHRISREFTFREFESLTQKDWLPIIGALRHNEWFTKITIENIKLSTENIDELCTVARLCKAIKDLRLVNCGLRQDFGTRFAHCLSVTHVENLDLSNNALEDKGLVTLSSSLQQRKLPLRSLNLQSCSITHKSLHVFHTALITNNNLLKSLQILNLSGNRIKDENCITLLFSNNENVLEELHLTDIEFSLETFFHSLATLSCKLRRLYISPIKSLPPSTISGGVKSFFTKTQTLEILQLSNANLSNDFLRELCDGLHSNIHLNKLDLRLSGNELESFVREYAHRFATIPCLTALDITGCGM
jgi:Ran GTPase-activating protein (RanGAP) involved in mRNA processing and transport